MPASPSVTVITLLVCLAGSVAAFIIAAVSGAPRSPRRLSPELAPAAPVPLDGPPPFPSTVTDGTSPYLPPTVPGAADLPPPPLPLGKVAVWPYRPLDLLWMGFIVAMFSLLSLANAAVVETKADVTISAAGLVQSIAFQLVIAALTLAMVVWRIRPVAWLGLDWKGWKWVLLIGPAAVLVMWGLSIVLYLTGYMEWMNTLGVESSQESVKLLQETQDPLVLVLMATAAVVVAPLCEELVFRGYLYPAAKRFAGPWVAGVASALIFAAAHGALFPLLPLFVFGMLLVLAYELTGSIWAPMAMHFCFNGATVAISLVVRLSGIELPDSL